MSTEQSPTIGELGAALADVQSKLSGVRPNSHTTALGGYSYADLEAIWHDARQALGSAGLAVVQTGEAHGDGEQYMATTLIHKSGEWIRGRLRIGTEGQNRGTNANQALGSSITYMRRYGLAAMLGMTVEEDDDGAASGYNSRTAKPAKNEVENAIHQQQARTAATSGVLDKLANAHPDAAELDFDPMDSKEKERLIGRIRDGEQYLAEIKNRNKHEARNSREKHLKTKVLEEASVADLSAFFEHLKKKATEEHAPNNGKSVLDLDIVTAVS